MTTLVCSISGRDVKSLAQSDVKEEVQCEESDPISNFWDRFTSGATTLFDGTPFG